MKALKNFKISHYASYIIIGIITLAGGLLDIYNAYKLKTM